MASRWRDGIILNQAIGDTHGLIISLPRLEVAGDDRVW
jgi:hypothetical protein